MNTLDALPPNVRAAFYAAFELLGLVLGAVEVAVLTTGHHWEPLTVALAVYGFLSARVHRLARSNVSTGPQEP